jgi:hypothetical protein
MSYEFSTSAVVTPVAASTASTTLFSPSTSVYGRNIYNASTAPCYLTYGTVSSTTAYTLQIAANTNYQFPDASFAGQVTGIWAAANGTAYTTQW